MAQHNAIIMSYANVLQKTFMSCRPSIVHPSINNMEISHTRSRTTGRRQDAGSHRVIRHLYDRSATLLFTIYSYIYIFIYLNLPTSHTPNWLQLSLQTLHLQMVVSFQHQRGRVPRFVIDTIAHHCHRRRGTRANPGKARQAQTR